MTRVKGEHREPDLAVTLTLTPLVPFPWSPPYSRFPSGVRNERSEGRTEKGTGGGSRVLYPPLATPVPYGSYHLRSFPTERA